MLRIMDMSTGKIVEDEFGSFEDEVLNAGWLPPEPGLQAGLQEVSVAATPTEGRDAESFLHDIYLNQG